MSIRARVGRHAKLPGQRHCQNWADDQQTVANLLNAISTNNAGASGSLGGRMVPGICGDPLYQAILRFEDRYFPGQRSGFVDPGGQMLTRMVNLASSGQSAPTTGPAVSSKPKPVEQNSLDILRQNLLNEKQSQNWTAGQRVAFDPLVQMAVKHVDSLKSQGFTRLGRPVEMFGRAHLFKGLAIYFNTTTWTIIWGDNYELFFIPEGVDPSQAVDAKRKAPPLPEMRYGQPVDPYSKVATEGLGALILFEDGGVLRIRAYQQTAINLFETGRRLSRGFEKHLLLDAAPI